MQIETLVYKSHKHILLTDIFEKYSSNGQSLDVPVDFQSDELKSIISVLFAYHFHYPEINNENRSERNRLLSDKNEFFNITRDFGRHLLENLTGLDAFNFKELGFKSFVPNRIFFNNDLLDFVETSLIDSMNIRQLEYGKFFLEKFSKLIRNERELIFNGNKINNMLINDADYLSKMTKQIVLANNSLEVYESILLIFSMKESFLKAKITNQDYLMASFIAQEKMFRLIERKLVLKETFSKCITLNWIRNRGLGGPRR